MSRLWSLGLASTMLAMLCLAACGSSGAPANAGGTGGMFASGSGGRPSTPGGQTDAGAAAPSNWSNDAAAVNSGGSGGDGQTGDAGIAPASSDAGATGGQSASSNGGTAGGIGAGSGAGAGAGSGGAGGAPAGGTGANSGGGRGGTGGSSGGGAGGQAAGLTTFITRQGLQFMDGNKRYVFVGANFWQGMSLGSAGPGGDVARLRRELDRLQALGVTNVRVVASAEGPDTEPYRIVPSLMPMPGVYNAQVFAGLDVLMDELNRRGIRAVMVLNNYWEWTGGMAQYVSWGQGTKIPYRLAPGGDYNTYIAYVDRFYACTTCQTMYRAHIQTVVNRINTVNGRKYRDDPTIFSWQLANEPRDYPANWIGDTAGYIKSLDPNHMVSVGSEGTWGGNFVTTHQSQSIDYTTCHIWVEPWGMYDANDSSAAALQKATDFATGYLRDHDTAARQLGKPLVMEEFGLARDGWTAGGKYDPAATVTNRDKYYRSLYTVIESSIAASGGALAGDNFWAWGGEARPPSKWTGDPPHETPGWFSIYDQDSTTEAVIAAHVAAIKR